MLFTKKSEVLLPPNINSTLPSESTPLSDTSTITKSKGYKKYSEQQLKDFVVGWVMQENKTDMIKYCKNGLVPRTTLLTYLKHIPQLIELRKKHDKTLEEVENIFDKYVKEKAIEREKQLEIAQQANHYLSPDEEGTLANLAILLGHCGRGICREELLDLINILLIERKDKRTFIPATMKTVEGLIKRNTKLKNRVRNAASIDPARAAQASVNTRDAMFTKLNNFIILLHELGLCKEKSYCKIKSSQIYNMDECALDTTR